MIMKPAANQISDEYLAFQVALQDSLGIVIGDDNRARIEGRLQPIMTRERLSRLSELAEALRQDQASGLRSDVLEAISTHDAAWFHFEEIHRLVTDYMLPSLVGKNAGECHLWYPACGNGQGVYSFAMVIREALIELDSDLDVKIIATDSSQEAIAFASAGRFPKSEVDAIPEYFRQRCMQAKGDDYRIDDNIREMVSFRNKDLQSEIADGKERFDAILCLDVLMYFSTGNKRHILDACAEQLVPAGMLLLNSGEMVLPFCDRFEMVEHDIVTFYRKIS